MPIIVPEPSADKTKYLLIDNLQGGWSTRSYPHRIRDDQVQTLSNMMHTRDNIWTVRSGNIKYGGGSGATGSGVACKSGYRFYSGNPPSGALYVHTGPNLYEGNDGTGAFTLVSNALGTTYPASFAQMYDPDASGSGITPGASMFVCDGVNVPRIVQSTSIANVNTGSGFLPVGVVSGASIKPRFVCDWDYHLVYANEPTDPCALWISDALHPERFTGTALISSNGTTYIPFYPGGQSASLGVITGIVPFGQYLIVFFTAGIVIGYNTGSYGAFQYVWETISRTLGCPAPQSIVAMDDAVFFFGGDKFYATDGQSIAALPDELPTIWDYSGQQTAPDIATITTVSAARRGPMYMAGYTSASAGGSHNNRVLVFDTAANGGWQFPSNSGGAWSQFGPGMNFAWGQECRGPNDELLGYPFFWGSSTTDLISQFDPSPDVFTDAQVTNVPITWEIITKSFYLDAPFNKKTITGLYLLLAFNNASNPYSITVNPFIEIDSQTTVTFSPQTITVPTGVSETYVKCYPAGGSTEWPQGHGIAAGASGNTSTGSLNIVGFMLEFIVDDVDI